MEDYLASEALSNPSDYLMRYYGKKVIILLDEYDSPMHEVYVGGYFIRNLFNSTFKSNPLSGTCTDDRDHAGQQGVCFL